MSTQDKINQCIKDIAALEQNKKELEAQLQKENLPTWIASLGTLDNKDDRLIINISKLDLKRWQERKEQGANFISISPNGLIRDSSSKDPDMYKDMHTIFGD